MIAHAGGTPFATVDEAWFWTMAQIRARRENPRYRPPCGAEARPCDQDDVVRCLDRLYRQRRIQLVHVRILRIWGDRQIAPNPGVWRERGDYTLWREALDRLEHPLRVKGILVAPPPRLNIELSALALA